MSDLGDIGGGDPSVGPLLGGATQPIDATARVGVTTDTQAISKLKSEFATLRAELEKVRKEMEGIASASQNISGPGGSATPAAGKIGNTKVAGGTFQAAVPGTQTGSAGGGGGGFFSRLGATSPYANIPGMSLRAAGMLAAAGPTASAVGAGIAQIDARADRGRDYALGADRMSVVYQQMYGMSQNQVANRYRTPMTQYRLGEGGINALMGMQVQTGISALQQASSVEALRTMSGFSISAGQATNMISQLAAPDVANRMFMMAGTGLIGAGGQQRTTTQVMQDLTRSAGLTNENLAKSALAPGSITRANLTMMGVTGDMQDMVIQYAQQNIQYKKAGGRGMYDPSSKEARKLMGIEDNFATQAEETDRLRVSREEQFYKRQADNFADLERQTQTLTKAMGALEDKLSGMFGAAISTKGVRGIAGSALKVAGMGAMFVNPGVGLGLMAAGTMLGDPVDGDKPIPYGYGSNKLPISQLSSKSGFSKLHSTFQDRLKKMFADNPAVGFGGGWRDPSYQEKMFRSRYTPTDKETNIFWDGQYWEHTSGAPAAPPGKSMHEIGLAADLVGDLDWVQKHAHEYGLKTFAGVNGEPWHVQPAELPNSRSEYEKQSAPWGTAGAPPASPDTKADVGEHSGTVPSAGATGALGTSGIQLSIAEKIAATKAYVSSKRTPSKTKGGSGKSSTQGTTVNASPGSRLSGEEVAKLLYAAGFRGQDLVMGVAISKRESGWNSGAHNPDRSTGDDSYGLFQINMMDKLGESRRPWFGISRNEDLYDPMINVSAAKKLYESGKEAKGDGWYHWGGYKGMAGNYSTNMAEATEIVKNTGLGDPMASFSSPGPRSRGGVTSVSGNHTFNISPSITINGSASGQDLQQMAREVARLIEKEVRMTTLRSN